MYIYISVTFINGVFYSSVYITFIYNNNKQIHKIVYQNKTKLVTSSINQTPILLYILILLLSLLLFLLLLLSFI